MKIILDGNEIEFNGNPVISHPMPKISPMREKYPNTKSWCNLIAFLINCDFLAISPQHILFTGEDIWNSHPTGELAYVLTCIDDLANVLETNEKNEFIDLCFQVLDGHDINATKNYASRLGLEFYKFYNILQLKLKNN